MVVRPNGQVLLTAEASGSALTQVLVNTFDEVAARSGQRLTVIDLVPPQSGDSDALSPFFVILGVLFPSLAAGAGSAIIFRRSHRVWCVAAPIVVAVLAGFATAGVAAGMTGFGDYSAIGGITALFSLAVSAPTSAFGRIKSPLVVVGALIFMVFGLPVSGGPSGLAPFGYGFLRELDSVLPLSAAATTVRNTIYFHGYDTAGHLWVLAAWAAGGLAALAALVTLGQRIPFLATDSPSHELEEIAPIDAALFEPMGDEVADEEKSSNQTASEGR